MKIRNHLMAWSMVGALASLPVLAQEKICFEAPPEHCPAGLCSKPDEPGPAPDCKAIEDRLAAAQSELENVERLYVPVLNVYLNGPQSPPGNTAAIVEQLALIEYTAEEMSGVTSIDVESAIRELERSSVAAIAETAGIDLDDPYPALQTMTGVEKPEEALRFLHTLSQQLVTVLGSEARACPAEKEDYERRGADYERLLQEMHQCEQELGACLRYYVGLVERLAPIYTLPLTVSADKTCITYEPTTP